MRILGIESSCDECSLAIVKKGKKIESQVIYSQLKEHDSFGGVVPELASRLHVKYIAVLYKKLLKQTNLNNTNIKNFIDGIGVTVGPGLSGSLLVGLHFAKGLALALDKPLVGINHIEAHFYSARLEHDISYPYIGVVISGGHSLIAIVQSFSKIEIIGRTLDDACGEIYEKIARELQLPAPGGLELDRLAQKGNAAAAKFPIYSEKGYDFSFSGLKTAVLHHRDKYWNKDYEYSVENFSAAFQYAAMTMIINRIIALVKETSIRRVALGGGVANNSFLQVQLKSLVVDNNSDKKTEKKACIEQLAIPSPMLCTDNAAMIAGLAYHYIKNGIRSDLDLGVQARINEFKNPRHIKTIKF